MRALTTLGLAWRAIRGHPLRSALTALGIVVAIAAVITFVSLGASLQAGIVGEVSPDDGGNIYGWAADPDAEGGPLAGAQPVFSDQDLDGVADREAVAAAYGYAPLRTQAIDDGDEEVTLGDGVVATGSSYVREDELREGRQVEDGEREAVLNPAAAGSFETNVSVGDDVTITYLGGGEATAEVVGITDTSEGLSPFEGFEAAPRAYLPADPFYPESVGSVGPEEGTEETSTGGTEDPRYTAIVVEAGSTNEAAVSDARTAATEALEADGTDTGSALDDELELTLQTSEELLQQLEDILDLLRNFVVGIAAISLLVGSIGIATVMLVSVTERTREIGIMKAVGATNRDVLGLFLAEAVALGILGALFGTVLGLTAGYVAAWYVDLPLVYPFGYVALAIGVGIFVGVLAGLYPAWRAARTDPIDALRYE